MERSWSIERAGTARQCVPYPDIGNTRSADRPRHYAELWHDIQSSTCDWQSPAMRDLHWFPVRSKIAIWIDTGEEYDNSESVETLHLASQFRELADRWYQETGMLSMIHKKAMHPAYQRIIGMGKAALPLIFRELKDHGGHWMWALCAITGEDAASPGQDFTQATEAWVRWGEENGYV